MQPGEWGKCLKYDYAVDNGAIYMTNCSTTNTVNDDHWEILNTTTTEGSDLFNLRHKPTQQCIPVNPENPGLPFDCFRYFGMREAIADSFNSLVDCDSDYAAAFERDDSSNLMFMGNSGCREDIFIDPVVVFMTYSEGELTQGKRVAVWGEKLLLDLEEGTQEYNFRSQWMFADVE